MPLDHYVTLGRSRPPRQPLLPRRDDLRRGLGLGLAASTESEAILDRFLERGGNFIDTANVYTKGHSEKIIGDHLGRDPARRDRVVIATKFFGNLYPRRPERRRREPQGDRRGVRGVAAPAADRLHRSLLDARAGTASRPSRRRCARSTTSSARARCATSASPTRPPGRCAQAQTIARFRGWSPLVALQIEYSLLERTVEGELVPMAREMGLGVTPWSPLKRRRAQRQVHARERQDVEADRGRARSTASSTSGAYAIIDDSGGSAAELETTAGARSRSPGSSARPGSPPPSSAPAPSHQLDDNLGALDVRLPRSSGRPRRGVEADPGLPDRLRARLGTFKRGAPR